MFRIGDTVKIKLSGDSQSDYDIRKYIGKIGKIISINSIDIYPLRVKLNIEIEPVEFKKEELELVEAKAHKPFGITKFWNTIEVKNV